MLFISNCDRELLCLAAGVKMANEVYCELYLMKSKNSGNYVLLYGYGQFHPSNCRPWQLEDKVCRVPVSVARSTLSRSDADALMMQLERAANFPLHIVLPKPQTLTIRGVERVRRPPVFRRPRMDPGAFDAAFGNRLCEVVELWNLDKEALLSDLTAGAASYREEVERLHEIIQLIASQVGNEALHVV